MNDTLNELTSLVREYRKKFNERPKMYWYTDDRWKSMEDYIDYLKKELSKADENDK